MSRLENVERVERTLVSTGQHFTVKNVVLTGIKGKDNIKLNPVFSRSYTSQKYSDKGMLEVISMRTSDYIVFGYSDFQAKKMEEIFISYPHMFDFEQFMTDVVNMVTTKDMFTGNNVNPKYKDVVIKLEGLGGGKSLAVVPQVIQNDQSFVKGIIMFINSEDMFVQIDVNNVLTMYYRLKNFNLGLESALLLNTAMVSEGGSSTGVNDSPNTFNSSSRGTGTFATRPASRGIFDKPDNGGAKAGINVGKPNNMPAGKPSDAINEEDIDAIINKGNEAKPDDNATAGFKPGKSPLSLNNILAGAKEIEVPDDLATGDGDIAF